MRRLGLNVKRLAWLPAIWHLAGVTTARRRETALAKDAEDKERIKAERLREALRANLRRRKAKPQAAADNNKDAPLTKTLNPEPPRLDIT